MDSQPEQFSWRSNPKHHHAQRQMALMRPYYEWILDRFGDDLKAPVVDAGAGVGNCTDLLARRALEVIALEGGKENIQTLTLRFSKNERVTIVECDLTKCAENLRDFQFESIISLDVLEHIQDDVSVLRQFHSSLPSGGLVLIKVPALPALYGPVDYASGHYRRYTRKSLRKAVETAGFTVFRTCYMNIAGVAPYFIKSRILKRQANFSSTFSERQIKSIAKLVPAFKLLDRVTGPVIGQSVLCVGRKA